MASDTRIFRLTRHDYEHSVEYCTRRSVSGKFGKGNGGRYRYSAVHATDAGATSGWTDVTREFIPSPELEERFSGLDG